MSEEIQIKIEGNYEEPPAVAAAAGAAANKSGPVECIDLLSDSDEDGGAMDSTPFSTTGDLSKFSVWQRGGKLRDRGAVSKKRPYDEDEDEDEEVDVDVPNVVTPRRRAKKKTAPISDGSADVNNSKKRPAVNEGERDDHIPKVVTPRKDVAKKISSSSNSSTDASSAEEIITPSNNCDAAASSTAVQSGKGAEFGDVGYKFHKLFFVNSEKTKTLYFHGEIGRILSKEEAVKGRDRECVYEDGEVECMSLIELRFLPRCTDPNCDNKMLTSSIKKHGPPEGKPNISVTQEEEEDTEEEEGASSPETFADEDDKSMGIDEGRSSPEDCSKASSDACSREDEVAAAVQDESEEDDEMASNPSNTSGEDGSHVKKASNDEGSKQDDEGMRQGSKQDAHSLQDPHQVTGSNSDTLADLHNQTGQEVNESNDDDSLFSSGGETGGIGNHCDENEPLDDKPNICDTQDMEKGEDTANESNDDDSLFSSGDENGDMSNNCDEDGPQGKLDIPSTQEEECKEANASESNDDGSLFSSDDEACDIDNSCKDDPNDREGPNNEMNFENGIAVDDFLGDLDGFRETDNYLAERNNGIMKQDDVFHHSGQYSTVGSPDKCGENESVASRFSDVEAEGEWGPRSIYISSEPKKAVRIKKELPASLVTDYVAPPILRRMPECYYFALQWGDRMRVEETKDPPQRAFCEHGFQYEILYTKLISKKGKGPCEDKMGNKYYKSYFLEVSGPGLEDIDLKSALASIGDFESLTYERKAYKTVSRLDLLVSPSSMTPGGKELCMHRLHPDMFELIEDNGHLGCGFIPEMFLVELLGKSAAALRKFAIQVRFVGPASIGVGKGMLVVKEGITKIQIPTSMVKVEKSKIQPLHTHVVLCVKQHFPWNNQWYSGRLIDDNEKKPTKNQLKGLKPICDDTLRVLSCKGVGNDVIEKYLDDFKQGIRFNHANLVGVSDPTGSIPEDHVFITGMGDKIPTKVFLTRAPCTEGSDGVIVKVASWKDIPRESYKFLSKIGFGAVVFPLGNNPLPPRINDGDLDGDPHDVIYDKELLDSITIDGNDEKLGEFLSDDIVGMKLPHKIGQANSNGNFEVIEKIQENPPKYLAANFDNKGVMKTTIEVTREQIFEGTDCLLKVIDHRVVPGAKCQSRKKSKENSVEFNCEWASGENKWELHKDLKKRHANGAPEALIEYIQAEGLLNNQVLPKKFCEWIKRHIVNDADIQEITKHRKNKHGEIEVFCKWSDGDQTWEPLEDQKEDCKLEVGAYAKKKKLFKRPGWEETEGLWLEEVQDLMCQQPRAREIKQLFEKCYAMWNKSFGELGGYHHDTVIWGRARKLAMKIEKHGGRLKLPRYLYYKLPKTLRENHAEIVL